MDMKDFSGGSSGKEPPANAGSLRDMGLIPGSVSSPGEGNGNPLQCPCLETPTEKVPGGLHIVHRVAKSQA